MGNYIGIFKFLEENMSMLDSFPYCISEKMSETTRSSDHRGDIFNHLARVCERLKCITCHDVQVLTVGRDSGRSEESVRLSITSITTMLA